MKKGFKNISKYFLILLVIMVTVGLSGCKPTVIPEPEKICPGCREVGIEHGKCEKCGNFVCIGNHEKCPKCGELLCVGNHTHPTVNPDEITIGIEGETELKSNSSMLLKAVVTGIKDATVSWSIIDGNQYATIDDNGKLTANQVDGDKIITVQAKLNGDIEKTQIKYITIIAIPTLTQAMLDELDVDTISFEGFINMDIYTIGIFEKLERTASTTVKTSMNGVNWFAEYIFEETETIQGLYYKNHNNLACQVGVSLMNEEKYEPMLDDNGTKISWKDAGLYNNFKGLKVSDFKFNEETWQYDYVGSDKTLIKRMCASANPYDFVPLTLSLVIEDGVILGIKQKCADDYVIAPGYRTVPELVAVVNTDQSIVVPTISKYEHDPIHDKLNEAIKNMHNLNNYTMEFVEIAKSRLAPSASITGSGYTENITENDCYYRPYTIDYSNNQEIKTYTKNGDYGYRKINEMLYNSYSRYENGYEATRAYEKEFDFVKPTFAFAAEIFTSYYVDEENGTTTYYVDSLMNNVATTFYYGVGNDSNLYGIFASIGKISDTQTFTPFVVVKDGYIVEACFAFDMGTLYGVIQLEYSEFNQTELPNDVEIKFDTRYVPTSWSELTIQVSKEDGGGTDDDVTVNALEYLKTFYKDENIEDKMPFFGKTLGDTYGFGLTTIKMPVGSDTAKKAIGFYYDVPLDIDYTITSSLKLIETYLLELGFTKNEHNEFRKGDICVLPTDSNLDLVIYVWKN